MTCFWVGIIDSISLKKMNKHLGITFIDKPKCHEFVSILKKKSIETTDVLWNDTELTNKQIEENLMWIKEINIDKIDNGYFCSVCDPVLLLICQLFEVNIYIKFYGQTIKYTNKKIICETKKNVLRFSSNSNHFWVN